MIKYCKRCEKDTPRNKLLNCLPCNNRRASLYRKDNKVKCKIARDIYLSAHPEMAQKFIATRKAKDATKAVCHLKADRDAAVIADLKSGMSATDAGLRHGISRQYALKLGSEHTRKAKIEADLVYPCNLFSELDASLLAYVAGLTGTVRRHVGA